MSQTARSFVVRGGGAAKTARQLSETARSLGRAAGGLLFTCGALGERLPELADALSAARLGFPVLLAAGAGVLTERGELEGESAAAGLLWSGGEAHAATVTGHGDELCLAVAAHLRERSPVTARTALVFLNPRGIEPPTLDALRGLERTTLLGGGTIGDAPVFAIASSGEPTRGTAGILTISGMAPPLCAASPACRLLMPLREITAAQGALVLAVDGEPTLEVLSAAARGLTNQPLVLVALAESVGVEGEPPPLLVRTVQGVDPSRGGILVSDEVKVGMRLAFAVRDAAAARADLELRTRALARECAGAAPRFGIYFNCASRGSSLYGAADVDTRVLAARFGQMPWLGLASSFEIAPYSQQPALQLYTGVIGLFTSPS
ncbi:MAG TPA: FIST C-terminal domain-containing protein [Polyangiaceae bacterium]